MLGPTRVPTKYVREAGVPPGTRGDAGDDGAADEQGGQRQDQRRYDVAGTEQVRQQRDERADREADERGRSREQRVRQVVRIDAELLADVFLQGLVRVGVELLGDLAGQIRVEALGPVGLGELDLLVERVPLDLLAFHLDLGPGQLTLRGDRGVLPRRHRERARGQAREPGQHDEPRTGLGAAVHAGDQREVRHQAVHRAEHGRPQPAAVHVPVGVVPAVLGGDFRGRSAGVALGS
jgi:hypothetical protein